MFVGVDSLRWVEFFMSLGIDSRKCDNGGEAGGIVAMSLSSLPSDSSGYDDGTLRERGYRVNSPWFACFSSRLLMIIHQRMSTCVWDLKNQLENSRSSHPTFSMYVEYSTV